MRMHPSWQHIAVEAPYADFEVIQTVPEHLEVAAEADGVLFLAHSDAAASAGVGLHEAAEVPALLAPFDAVAAEVTYCQCEASTRPPSTIRK